MSRRSQPTRLNAMRLTRTCLSSAWIHSWYRTSATLPTPAIRLRVTLSRQASLSLSDGKWSRANRVHGRCHLLLFTQCGPNTRTNSGSDPELVQVGLLEEVVAVAGVDRDVDERRLAQDLERNDGAGRAHAPHAPPGVGEPRGLLAGHLDHDVADLHARAFGRRAGCDARDDELRARLGGVHAEPGTRLAPGAPQAQHVSLQHAAVALFLDQQRTDGEELAVGADERGAAPLRMGGGGVDGFVEHVLPVAGELALREHRRAPRARPAAA